MKKIYRQGNSSCIDCGAVEYEMCRVGGIILCDECCKEHFPDGEFDHTSDIYLKLLKLHKEQAQKE